MPTATAAPDEHAPIIRKEPQSPEFQLVKQLITPPEGQPNVAFEQKQGAPEIGTTERIGEYKTERGAEKTQVQKEERFLDETIEGLKKTLSFSKKKHVKIPQVRDDVAVQVERIMEEGLKDAYQELSPVEKQEFKIKGEQTALAIRELLKATKVKVKKIFQLLFAWLKLLPGINRFFLEQEAKIKTDQIVALKEWQK